MPPAMALAQVSGPAAARSIDQLRGVGRRHRRRRGRQLPRAGRRRGSSSAAPSIADGAPAGLAGCARRRSTRRDRLDVRSTPDRTRHAAGGSPSTRRSARSASPARRATCGASRSRGACARRARRRPPSVRRSSQRSSSSWSAALPMRIGGFDQIRSKRRSSATSSGSSDLDGRDAVGGRVGGTQLAGALVHVDRDHPRAGRPRAPSTRAIAPGAAAEVEERARRRRRRRLAQQELGARVELAVAEHAAVGRQPQVRLRRARDGDLLGRPTARTASGSKY